MTILIHVMQSSKIMAGSEPKVCGVKTDSYSI